MLPWRRATAKHYERQLQTFRPDSGCGCVGRPWQETQKARRKKHRRKSYETLGHIDNAIRVSTQADGLRHFMVKPEELRAPRKPFEWPHLHIVLDKGPDNTCGAQFLVNQLGANVTVQWGPCHGAFTSVKTAIRAAGLMSHCIAMDFAYNAHLGEWKDGIRGAQIRKSVRDTITTLHPAGDLAFSNYLPAIMQERSLESSIGDPAVELEVWRSLLHGGSYAHDEPRCGLAKFFGFTQRYACIESSVWAERAWCLETACQDLDLMPKKQDTAPRAHQPAEATAQAKKRHCKSEDSMAIYCSTLGPCIPIWKTR